MFVFQSRLTKHRISVKHHDVLDLSQTREPNPADGLRHTVSISLKYKSGSDYVDFSFEDLTTSRDSPVGEMAWWGPRQFSTNTTRYGHPLGAKLSLSTLLRVIYFAQSLHDSRLSKTTAKQPRRG